MNMNLKIELKTNEYLYIAETRERLGIDDIVVITTEYNSNMVKGRVSGFTGGNHPCLKLDVSKEFVASWILIDLDILTSIESYKDYKERKDFMEELKRTEKIFIDALAEKEIHQGGRQYD